MPVFNVANSALSTLTQTQQDNLALMANTDIRTVLSSLTSLSTVQASQAISVALNTADVTDLKSIAVIEKTQVLEKTGFVFFNNLWTINVFHELDNKFPVTAIFDATGDVQFIQFVGKDLMNGTVELTQSQYNSNAFPLSIVLHSKISAAVETALVGQWKLDTITNKHYRLLNGDIESSLNTISAELAKVDGNVSEAYLLPVAALIAFKESDLYYRIWLGYLDGPWMLITPAQYQNYITDPTAIAL